MNLILHRTKTGTYKLLTKSTKVDKGLQHIANLLSQANKYSEIKMGVYAVGSSEFTNKVLVKSLTSGKSQRFTKKEYYKFLNGKKQIVVKVKKEDKLTECKTEQEWKQQEDELMRSM